MKVIVTGGAGFIGSNLVRRLNRENIQVSVIDDFSTGYIENLHNASADIVEGSILDSQLLAKTFHSADAVIHLAARPSVPRSLSDPLASHHANTTGTLQVLEAVRHAKVKHLVVASSSSVYGANPTLPKVETLLPMPMSPYAVSKLAAETYTLSYANCFGLRAIAFRFFNVYGPNQRAGHAYAAVIPAFIDSALCNKPLNIHGDGLQTRDFTHVDDVVEILTRSTINGVTSPVPVNLAFGTRASLLDVISEIEVILEHPVLRSHQKPRDGDVRDSQANNRNLRELFPGIEPVKLHDGLSSTIAWFRASEGHIDD